MNVLQILEQQGVINKQTRESVESKAQSSGASLESLLMEQGVDPTEMLQVLGAHYNMPTYVVGENQKIDPSVLKYVPEDSARHYRVLPLALEDGIMKIGIVDPDEMTALDALNFISAKNKIPYKLFLILEKDFNQGIQMYENLTGEVDEALSELESELTTEIEARKTEKKKEEKEEEYIKEDAPVTKIVATVIRYAVDGRASDIHVEPTASKVRVRFRVDGVLTTSLELPRGIHSAIVARVKILTSMRLDEKRKPQDGRFSANIDNKKIDFRVSTFPTYYGEKVVMRILDPESNIHSLEDAGLTDHNLELVRQAVKAPYGIILISGPTGSGKSTTLHNMLSEVDRSGKNVLSLEDPVEYNIEGVSQSQVRPEIGYTFASGLRSLLRQDPDIIMVGEIRDRETAQLAIQAALTGHLVLSTIHTNNAIGVVPRLIDMGVDPYLIAPTLTLAMAQRLVRRICPNTGKKTPVEGSIQQMIDHEFEGLPKQFENRIPHADHILRIEHTAECPNGTRGRIGVFEVMEITDEIERLILNDGSEAEMYEEARKQGFMSMKEDAIIKAMNHEIPFEEVNTLGGALLVDDTEVAETSAASQEQGVDNPNTRKPAEDV